MCIASSFIIVINYKGADTMYTIQELIKEHVQEKCRYCARKECDGIHINTNNEATCEREREE